MLILAAVLSGCQGGEDVYLRLAGSNTIGAELAPQLAVDYMETEMKAKHVTLRPTSAETIVISGDVKGEKVAIQIASYGSGTGFDSLAAGEADIAMASRPIKPAELEELGADYDSPPYQHVIGWDGLAVIVNRLNPVNQLSIEEVRKIFTGEIDNWAAVGGPEGRISTYIRPDKSGTFATFKEIVMNGGRQIGTSFEDSKDLSEAVAKNVDGIGYVSFTYIRNNKAIALRGTEKDAIEVRNFTITNADYPLRRKLFMYADKANGRAQKFIQYVRARSGQTLLRQVGFVTLKEFRPSVKGKEGLPEEYLQATTGAMKIPHEVPFEVGHSQLSPASLAGLGKLMQSLRRPSNRNRQLIIIGHSSKAASEAADAMGLRRAATVQQYLSENGIGGNATVLSVGNRLPKQADTTYAARLTNSRVEIWIK